MEHHSQRVAEHHGTARKVAEHHGTAWKVAEHHGTSHNVMEHHSQKVAEQCGTVWNIMEHHRRSWNIAHRTSWKVMETWLCSGNIQNLVEKWLWNLLPLSRGFHGGKKVKSWRQRWGRQKVYIQALSLPSSPLSLVAFSVCASPCVCVPQESFSR